MATNWIFYPPHPELLSATFTATAGTSSSISKSIDTRIKSLMEVDTVGTYISGADEFMYRIDFGVGVTKVVDFIALVNHNLLQEAANLTLYIDTADNASLTSAGTVVSSQAAAAGDEPIWLEEKTASVVAKRYYWVHFDQIAATAYAGEVLIGEKVEPSVDPNWETPIEVDIESGRIVNISPGGSEFITRTHGIKRGWQVKYQFLNDADETIMRTWLEDTDFVDTPFVFTRNGGTSFHYGRLIGNPIWTPMQAGLYDLQFTIAEVIA